MHASNELYSHSLRYKPHGCEFLHHQKTLVMAYRCLYEGNILLFPFYIIMFYTARCSFYPVPKQPAKPERKRRRLIRVAAYIHGIYCWLLRKHIGRILPRIFQDYWIPTFLTAAESPLRPSSALPPYLFIFITSKRTAIGKIKMQSRNIEPSSIQRPCCSTFCGAS